MSPQPDVDERLDKLEQLVYGILARAGQHPVGRRILAFLGLDGS